MSESYANPFAGYDLDEMDGEALDALPFGVIQLTDNGMICFYNRAEAEMAGRDPARTIGKNFFRDVAPCSDVPQFRGRFDEGIRHGILDETFIFNFDFDMKPPVQVRVWLKKGVQENTNWLLTQVIKQHKTLEDIHLETDTSSSVKVIGLQESCENEPIHIPGAIQDWGALLIVDRQTLTVTGYSDNVFDLLRIPQDAICTGHKIEDIFNPHVMDRLDGFEPHTERGFSPSLRFSSLLQACPEEVDLRISGNGQFLFFEITIASKSIQDRYSARELLDQTEKIRRCRTIKQAAQTAAEIMVELSGMERVLVYKFDTEWNGETIAELNLSEKLPSFLGLFFPKTDIPAQARAIYLTNKARFTPSRDYTAVPLTMTSGLPEEAQNLSSVQLRSVSPVHRLYHKNIGINGSMSLSLVVGGRLWGLIIGHHSKPHHLNTEQKMAATLIADTLSAQIDTISSEIARQKTDTERALMAAFMESLSAHGDLLSFGQAEDAPSLPRLFGSKSASVYQDGAIISVGEAPPEELVNKVVEHIKNESNELIWYHERLSTVLEPFADWQKIASGVLVVRPSTLSDTALLWFLPERIRVIEWAGEPTNKRDSGFVEGRQTLLPRKSFQRWTEVTKGWSVPIETYMVSIAESLALSIGEFMVRRSERIATINNELGASNAHLNALIDSMSEAVISLDKDMNVESFSRGARNIFETDKATSDLKIEEFIGDKGIDIVRELSNTPNSNKVERLIAYRSDGSDFPADISLGNWLRGEDLMTVLLISDKSERSKLEDLASQQSKLEALGQFAGSVAHDFNNFLSIISGNLQLAAMANKDPKIAQRLEPAQHAVRRGAELTDRLLGIIRARPGSQIVVNLQSILRANKDLFISTLGKDTDFVMDIDESVAPVSIEAGLLENVIINLLNNSRDALGDDGLIRIKLEKATLNDEDAALLIVEDNGKGMDAETQKKALEPFYSTKPMGKGTGLGLSTLVRLAKNSNGKIDIRSEVNRGTEILLYLPCIASDKDRAELASSDQPCVPDTLKNKRLLLADDDRKLLTTTAEILALAGFEVVKATSLKEAEKLFATEREFGVVLTDINFHAAPDGYKIADLARKTAKHSLIFGLSGDIGVLGAQANAQFPILKKPLNLRRFIQLVSDAVRTVE